MRRLGFVTLCGVVVLALAASACGGGGSGGASADGGVRAKSFDGAKFSKPATVDNEWFPLRPGTQLVFRGSTTEGKESVSHRVIFTVTDLTKKIGGVRSVVLWDRDYSAGDLVEAEIAFFAQDDNGNVWQLGEYPEEYENGEIVKSPLWMHGLQGARAGLTMRAAPRTGTSNYSLGWGPAVGFNDRARVLKTGAKTCVPLDCYTDVLITDEYNPDEPGKHQLKYYARGVGNVRVGWAGKNEETKETLVLVEVRRLDAKEMADARAAAYRLEASAYDRKKVYAETPPLERG